MLLESIWACELTLRVPYVAEIRALVDADLDRGAQIYMRVRRMRRKCVYILKFLVRAFVGISNHCCWSQFGLVSLFRVSYRWRKYMDLLCPNLKVNMVNVLKVCV